MKVIGITGGVGAGKSAVLSYLEEAYDARVILADWVANKIKEPGECCYDAIVNLLGDSILMEDGFINRKRMGQMIFSDPELLRKTNEIIHPAVKTYIIHEMNKAKEEGVSIFVIEAALLLEDNYRAICDELWYIYTREEVRRERLKANRKYSDEYISSIMEKQLSDEVFRRECDFVIDNSDSIEYTKTQIDCKMLKEKDDIDETL